MTCRQCGVDGTGVERTTDMGTVVLRKRVCSCGYAWTTVEDDYGQAKAATGVHRRALMPARAAPCALMPPGAPGGVGGGVSGDLANKAEPNDRESVSNPISRSNQTRARVRGQATGTSGPFEAFYALYPRKKKRPRAWRAWVAQDCEGVATAVMDGLRRQLRELQDRPADKVPHPATWLNDREWEDPATKAPPPDPRCPFHRRPDSRGLPAHYPLDACPECKHAKAATRMRVSEPTPFLIQPALLPTAEQMAELRQLRRQKSIAIETAEGEQVDVAAVVADLANAKGAV